MNQLSPDIQNIIRQYCFGITELNNAQIILLKSARQLNAYKSQLADSNEYGGVWKGCSGTFHGQKIHLLVVGNGASQFADCILAIGQTNSTIIFPGTCGGLKKGVSMGDVIVPEHTSGFVALPKFLKISSSKNQLSYKRLGSHIQKLAQQKVHIGSIYSTCSFAAENYPDFPKTVPLDAIAIDMETATFFTTCDLLGIKRYAFHWITDLPYLGKSFYQHKTLKEQELCKSTYLNTPLRNLEIIVKFKDDE